MADPPEVKILLLGDSEVGKSTFLSRLSTGTHLPPTPTAAADLPTLHDMNQPFIFSIRMYNRAYRFEFYDTASPENYTLLTPDVVILCFSCVDRRSLENCQCHWAKQTTTLYAPNREIPLMLLGLKRDLRSSLDDKNTIHPQEAYRIAQELRCDRYAECSALTGELVREVFEDLARIACLTTTGEAEGGKTASPACCVM